MCADEAGSNCYSTYVCSSVFCFVCIINQAEILFLALLLEKGCVGIG